MKKNKIHIALIAAVVTLFSSCLGETYSSQESGNTVGYITVAPTTGSVMPAAYVSGFGYVTAEAIRNTSNFVDGRFYEMSFKYDSRDGSTEGASNVKDVKFVNLYGDPIPDPWEDERKNSYYGDALVADTKEIYPTALSLGLFSYWQQAFNDRFVFAYKCTMYEDEIEGGKDYGGKVELVAYFDANNQHTGTTGEVGTTPALDNDKIRLNLRLRRTSTGEPGIGAKEKTYTGLAVIDLSEVRRKFMGRGIAPEGDDPGVGYIQFQYNAYNSSDKNKPTVKTIGSFTPEATDVIGMYFF